MTGDACGCNRPRFRTWDDALTRLLEIAPGRGRMMIVPCPRGRSGYHVQRAPS